MTPEELKPILETCLSKELNSAVTVSKIKALIGGACQENSLVDLEVGEGPHKGSHALVMRADKGGSLLSSLSRLQEYAVALAAFKAGVKTPEPFLSVRDESYTGKPFYLMQRIPGKATGRYVVKDASLNTVRKTFAKELAVCLASVHSVSTDDPSLNFLTKPEASSFGVDAVSQLRHEIDLLPQAHPAMELALNWLEANAKTPDKLVLVHGDYRTGNFMVSPEGFHGLLDWEFAHFGDRHEDISWLCMRDWRFGKLNKEVGGFADRKDFYEEYEKAAGVSVDPFKVLYWEVMGNLRWALGSVQQAERHLTGKAKGIELAAIGRRTSEMEFEMLRLIENAR